MKKEKKYEKILAAIEAVKNIGGCRNAAPKRWKRAVLFQLSFLESYYFPENSRKYKDISL